MYSSILPLSLICQLNNYTAATSPYPPGNLAAEVILLVVLSVLDGVRIFTGTYVYVCKHSSCPISKCYIPISINLFLL